MIKGRPILFTAPMVKAILSGQKTMTRRPLKPQPHGAFCDYKTSLGYPASEGFVWAGFNNPADPQYVKCDFGQPCDLLWVKETFAYYPDEKHVIYREREGGPLEVQGFDMSGCWRPSIHMPRWASRLLLEVTDVRVERVQEISEADAVKEGCVCRSWESILHDADWNSELYAHNVFSGLWDSIYAKRGYSWVENPWVWVVEFKVKETSHE